MKGQIYKVMPTKGYGFIYGEDGNQYFMQVNLLRDKETWDAMKENIKVEFSPSVTGAKGNGLRATDIRVIPSDPQVGI